MPWIQEPTFRVSDRDGYFTLDSDLIYEHPEEGTRYRVPAGFETNFASVPYMFQWYFRVNGKSRLPAALHDYQYREESNIPRKKSDRIFLRGCKEKGMRSRKARIGYRTLRMFGGIHQRLS